MEPENAIRRLTDLDETVQHLLPFSFSSSGFFYAFLLLATLVLSILSVVLFR